MVTIDDVQKFVDGLLVHDSDRISGLETLSDVSREVMHPTFHPFDNVDDIRSGELAAQWWNIVQTDPGEQGLQSLLDSIKEAVKVYGAALINDALKTFVIHHGADVGLTLLHFLRRHPCLATRSNDRQVNGPEGALNWFREDIFLSEHHEHWHSVYKLPSANCDAKDRQGELFIYMHQQMLARYNTERVALGLDLVEPFPLCRFGEAVPEGYDPGIPRFGIRPPYSRLYNSIAISLEELECWSRSLFDSIMREQFPSEKTDPAINGEDLLGHTILGSKLSVDMKAFGTLHGTLHTKLANISKPLGVMDFPQVSANDPVFYLFHRFLDDLAVAYQDRQKPNNICNEAPAVRIRSAVTDGQTSHSPDIILSLQKQLDWLRRPDESLACLGERLFGGERWDTDLTSDPQVATQELYTHMRQIPVQLSNNSQPTLIRFLDLVQEFYYFIRLENLKDHPQTIAVRIFLAPKYDRHKNPLYNDRRMWIEMDTFQAVLKPNAKEVICRPASLSSVIKKSNGQGLTPDNALKSLHERPVHHSGIDYCDCGWPYSLLLPRGTSEGMSFRLMVLITGDDILMPAGQSSCGSVRLCGAQNSQYPDRKKMGYPFNRPFAGDKTLEKIIAEQHKTGQKKNLAARDIHIVCQSPD